MIFEVGDKVFTTVAMHIRWVEDKQIFINRAAVKGDVHHVPAGMRAKIIEAKQLEWGLYFDVDIRTLGIFINGEPITSIRCSHFDLEPVPPLELLAEAAE